MRNWERFQHYRDRNPPWIKLHTELLDNYDFSQLSDASKLLALCITVLAARSDNKIPADPAWIMARCSIKTKPDLDALIKANFIERIQPLQSSEQDASSVLAVCKQSAMPEERRGEREAEGASAPLRRRRVPPDFHPDESIALTALPDIDVAVEIQKFRDWEFKTPRSDWAAVWRTWVSNCQEKGKYARAKAVPVSPTEKVEWVNG